MGDRLRPAIAAALALLLSACAASPPAAPLSLEDRAYGPTILTARGRMVGP